VVGFEEVAFEGFGGRVEGNVAGESYATGYGFLASSGGAGDEGMHLVHARVERAQVALHIVSEDGLPDAATEAIEGGGVADEGGEDVVEGASNLEEECGELGNGIVGLEVRAEGC